MNRVTQRNYVNPPYSQLPTTPDVTYTYDNVTNAKGKLTKVSSSVSTTEYTSFDILGRVTAHKQTTDGTDYPTTYTYKQSGALDEETYPSTRVVKNVLAANGDLATVQSTKNSSSNYFDYGKNFTYSAAGAVTSMQLGNGRWESTQFNSRLQPTEIALGATQNATDFLKLDFTYNSTNATDDNGNVLTQTITVPAAGGNQGFTATQTYAYDSLNRIRLAAEVVGSTETWRQTFTFDRYGNRNLDTTHSTEPVENLSGFGPPPNPEPIPLLLSVMHKISPSISSLCFILLESGVFVRFQRQYDSGCRQPNIYLRR